MQPFGPVLRAKCVEQCGNLTDLFPQKQAVGTKGNDIGQFKRRVLPGNRLAEMDTPMFAGIFGLDAIDRTSLNASQVTGTDPVFARIDPDPAVVAIQVDDIGRTTIGKIENRIEQGKFTGSINFRQARDMTEDGHDFLLPAIM